ncbi:hypothetical protein ACB496_15515 [Lelliottia nimipressuralis]|uniref:hypothetical protein n=1 Tax=Lelliottia nimipressuralis TaxID=69220 RepID=UPI0035560CF3
MKTVLRINSQRKVSALLRYLIAGAGILSSVPVLAEGAIYDAKISDLTITARVTPTCSITPHVVAIDLVGKQINNPNAGGVDVDCGASSEVALAISKDGVVSYDVTAVGVPQAGAAGQLTIKLDQANATSTTMTASNNFSGHSNISKMLVSNTTGKSTFNLLASTDVNGITAAGDFKYSLLAAAWME